MEQLSGMLDFFLENSGLAGGKFHRLHGRMEHEKKWEEMASKLNAIGGAQKSAEQWRTVSNKPVKFERTSKQRCCAYGLVNWEKVITFIKVCRL